MSCIKRWYEEHIDEVSDEELLAMGHSEEDIEWLREVFSEN